MKLLYSFSEIIGREIQELDKTDIINLSHFILGHNIEGNIERYIFKTNRTITTHNTYFDDIRKYIMFSRFNKNEFFDKVQFVTDKISYSANKVIVTSKYTTNKSRHKGFNQYVPKYISVKEYTRVLEYIDENVRSEFKLRNKLIIDLMFLRGLRIGEVLGITLEDIIPHPDDKRAGQLYLRNRVSDKKYQHAKGCMKVFSSEMYKTKIYNSEREGGYQVVALPIKLMDEVRKYQEISRDILNQTERKLENIMKYAKADCVGENTRRNYYLFLNKNGSPLSPSGWNNFLKEIFIKIGISIDKNSKEDNLNHRFRHGYAMYLIDELNKDISYVQKEMRHKSIQSTLKYYNPKPEDQLKETEKIQKEILDKIKGNTRR
ncbi:tyrosine-type recombinase/integrase [Clostridium thermopalmarium]|uniref:Site-specific tyrosine recombinase XerC n=1 Tax=Clostridium thermopalmarium DSM 5974 TaxID=1121340 RepID=A0A2T0AQF0_9CLOT|nr:site-specific integrase [Clostridium thermopalmarium]PRR71325.1 site-specific tyrosine recombinase XerC [Clostridium thermopalmarium DSM 5974]PVZ15779.1 integrase/recombinase XerD [Clostridium thermopalmarium DSM 5974]